MSVGNHPKVVLHHRHTYIYNDGMLLNFFDRQRHSRKYIKDGMLLNEVGHGMHQMHNCLPARQNLPIKAYKYDSEYPLTEFQISSDMNIVTRVS